MEKNTITVGQLKEQLKTFSDDMTLDFGGLEFYRLKARGENLLQVEFSQTVYTDSSGNVIVEN